MERIGNHPEIDWIESTGYPSHLQPEPIYCEMCGEDISDEEYIYEDSYHNCLCENCLLKYHRKDW
jgi:hypothetical protein